MRKKIIIGSFFVILSFCLFIFLNFKSKNKKKLIKKKKNIELVEKENLEKAEEDIVSSNIIEDVSYSAKDTKGNEYFVKASEGTIDQNESNFIFFKVGQFNYKFKRL